MASTWDGKAFGTDVSGFQDSVKLADGAIDFGVARMNISNGYPVKDAQFANHIQAFYDCKALPMAYWVVNSEYYTIRQMNISNMQQQSNDNHPVLNCMQECLHAGAGWKAIGAVWMDLEIQGAGDVWNAAYLEDIRTRSVDLKKINKWPNIPLGVYSRLEWIERNPAVQVWLEQHPEILIWTSNYRKDFPGLVAKSMQQVKETRQPGALANHKPFWFGDNPAKPKQYRRFWQYHGTAGGCQPVTCPEVSGNKIPSGLDLNVSEYTRKELFAAFNATDRLGAVEPPPPPVDPPTDTDHAAILARLDALAKSVNTINERLDKLRSI